MAEPLIPKHGGYRRLITYRLGMLIYDATVAFCARYIDRRDRTHDQMVQAARSGVANIVEGSEAAATSKKTELKLTNVAKAARRNCFSIIRLFCGNATCRNGLSTARKLSPCGRPAPPIWGSCATSWLF